MYSSHHTGPSSCTIPVLHLHQFVIFDACASQAQGEETQIGPSRHRYTHDGSTDKGDHDMPRVRYMVNVSTIQDTLKQIAQPGKWP